MAKVVVKCRVCGTDLYKYPSQIKNSKTGKFICGSSNCRSESRKGENNPAWIGGKVQKVCDYCGKPKEVWRCFLETDKNHFCDKDCHDNWQRECKTYDRNMVTVKCAFCSKPIEIWPRQARRTKNNYCGGASKCQQEHYKRMLSMEGNPRWLGGISFETYPAAWREELRELIRTRDLRICQVCGKSEVDNGRKLDVHHINYNKDNLNNENLISLCKSCHCKTTSNREYWQSYFASVEEVAANG